MSLRQHLIRYYFMSNIVSAHARICMSVFSNVAASDREVCKRFRLCSFEVAYSALVVPIMSMDEYLKKLNECISSKMKELWDREVDKDCAEGFARIYCTQNIVGDMLYKLTEEYTRKKSYWFREEAVE
ncbi:MAG: hypothetical protein QXT13_07365 [Pyrobaculum sp.]